ncbi:MAG: response regulator [Elusimicrobiota bacterium]|nr:response regulator [Endomicrobiia bacterium]MCX7910216.1 response regulator [Endomicrobiia bacterium]MDW8165267.1 response regulator [Elusimicrobiota bacterium]
MDKEKRLQLGLLKIGELAEKAGVPVSTIKYYTDLELLRVQDYMAGGFRLYNEKESLLRLKRIKEMLDMGYSIKEIKENIEKITVFKVLVIDDEQEVHEFVYDVLEMVPNIEVKSAYDGFSAGIIISEYLPDLIILDLLLPGVDGFKVCSNIKNNPKLKHIKILAITGYDSKEYKEKILNAGADDYLPKPMELNLFREKVNKLLDLK